MRRTARCITSTGPRDERGPERQERPGRQDDRRQRPPPGDDAAARRGPRRVRLLRPPAHAARRDPGPLGHAGDRLHRVAGTEPRSGRGPGHLPDLDRTPRRAEGEVRARSVLLRALVRLRHLRGRNGHVLGALARARVPERGRRPSCPTACSPPSARTRPASAGSSSTPWSTAPAHQDLAELRSLQDWNIRYALESVDGVAEVASVGGFVKQYQVQVDPNRMLALRHHARAGDPRRSRRQRGRRRADPRDRGPRADGARARLHPQPGRHRRGAGEGRATTERRSSCATSPR